MPRRMCRRVHDHQPAVHRRCKKPYVTIRFHQMKTILFLVKVVSRVPTRVPDYYQYIDDVSWNEYNQYFAYLLVTTY